MGAGFINKTFNSFVEQWTPGVSRRHCRPAENGEPPSLGFWNNYEGRRFVHLLFSGPSRENLRAAGDSVGAGGWLFVYRLGSNHYLSFSWSEVPPAVQQPVQQRGQFLERSAVFADVLNALLSANIGRPRTRANLRFEAGVKWSQVQILSARQENQQVRAVSASYTDAKCHTRQG
jgi:hypothetical protein